MKKISRRSLALIGVACLSGLLSVSASRAYACSGGNAGKNSNEAVPRCITHPAREEMEEQRRKAAMKAKETGNVRENRNRNPVTESANTSLPKQ
ncbi:hypothetical protein [Herbaspirillum sp.]|uniref:hypothetical protein n=1 Tax=Herbaspirillum sp. TaxID=1890675 RepID=UPI001AFDC674|nr:hypothetical protein [Herbaspirillum sp.]MBO9538079.1 hypothetical protein [Herbaspirillum sp.]